MEEMGTHGRMCKKVEAQHIPFLPHKFMKQAGVP